MTGLVRQWESSRVQALLLQVYWTCQAAGWRELPAHMRGGIGKYGRAMQALAPRRPTLSCGFGAGWMALTRERRDKCPAPALLKPRLVLDPDHAGKYLEAAQIRRSWCFAGARQTPTTSELKR